MFHPLFTLDAPVLPSAQIPTTGIVIRSPARGDLQEMADPEPDLRRLMYISRVVDPLHCSPRVMEELTAAAKRRNQALHVTGFLLFSTTHFVQVLEGPAAAVRDLYAVILRDRRHTDCTIVLDTTTDCRLYSDWHLKIADISALTFHPLVCHLLRQLATCFIGMWSYLPQEAALLLLQGRVPMEERPQSLGLVVAFIHIAQYRELLRHESLQAHMTDLLTCFTDECETHVHGSGGRIAKFINGCCMAYWPLAHAAKAVCGIASLLEALADRRDGAPPGSPRRLLYATAGVHCGRALLCNAGTRRADLTLLGDSVNTCARVASLAAKLQHSLLLTANVAAVAQHGLPLRLEPAGMHALPGREQLVECFCVPGPVLDSGTLQRHMSACGLRRTGGRPLHSPVPMWQVMSFGEDCTTDAASVPGFLMMDQLSPDATSILDPQSPSHAGHRLITLTYISHLPAPTLFSLQQVSRKRNEAVGVTSCLLYLSGLVVQALEGPEVAVLATWERIRRDPRHTGVVLVAQQPIAERTHLKPFAVEVVTQQMMDTFPPVCEVLGQLARSFVSLEVYMPSAVVRHLTSGGNPLMTLKPRQADVVMLASDVCSFTMMSEAAPLEGVWHVCTTFTDLCTAAITEHGGETVKLIGDCVLAYFPAGLAVQALTAGQDIVNNCLQVRLQHRSSLDFRSLIHCGVGLDFGSVVMTHTGSLRVRDYALVGEVCMRVLEAEALSRTAGRAIILTEAVAKQLPLESLGVSRLSCAYELHGRPTYAMAGPEWALQPAAIKREISAFRSADGDELQKSLSCISDELLQGYNREASPVTSATLRSRTSSAAVICAPVPCEEFTTVVVPNGGTPRPPAPRAAAFAATKRHKPLARLFLCCVGRA